MEKQANLFEPEVFLESAAFKGADYDEERDRKRLTGQIKRVFEVMRDGKYRSMEVLQAEILKQFNVRDQLTSLSAQVRNLRKQPNGGHTVNRKHIKNGFYKYQLIENKN